MTIPFHCTCLIFLLGSIILRPCQGKPHESTPRFLLPEGQKKKRYTLKTVYDQFQKRKLPEYKGDADKNAWDLAKDTDSWDLMWTRGYTEFQELGPLDAHHRINHFPGGGILTMKSRLREAVNQLQHQYGPGLYGDMMPRNFLLPQQLAEFRQAAKEEPDVRWILESENQDEAKLIDGDFKFPNNREVIKGNVITQIVDPLLIGGRRFEIGLYVLVNSLEPLRVFVHSYSKLRFCKQPYPKEKKFSIEKDQDSFLIGRDHLLPWEVEALAKSYKDKKGSLLPLNQRMQINDMDVLKTYMSSHINLNYTKVENDLYHKVGLLTAGVRSHLVESAHALKTAAGSQNFFELFRFDFVLDKDVNPWLMRINQSPNLVRTIRGGDGMSDQYQLDRVVGDLLNVILARPRRRLGGFLPDHHPEMIKYAMGQYNAKLGYKMIVPDTAGVGLDFDPFMMPLDKIQWEYFQPFASLKSRFLFPYQWWGLFLGCFTFMRIWWKRRRDFQTKVHDK